MVNMEVYSLFIKWLGAIQRESGERGPVSHDGAIILLLQKLVIGPIFDYIRVCILLCSALTRSVNSCKTCKAANTRFASATKSWRPQHVSLEITK
jgi:hypothetical protein